MLSLEQENEKILSWEDWLSANCPGNYQPFTLLCRVATNGHTYLNKPAAFRCTFVSVCISFWYFSRTRHERVKKRKKNLKMYLILYIIRNNYFHRSLRVRCYIPNAKSLVFFYLEKLLNVFFTFPYFSMHSVLSPPSIFFLMGSLCSSCKTISFNKYFVSTFRNLCNTQI